jgi:hypothetical protein
MHSRLYLSPPVYLRPRLVRHDVNAVAYAFERERLDAVVQRSSTFSGVL